MACTCAAGASASDDLELVLDRTPCYAESGGQVADRGTLTAEGVSAPLTHVYREGESIVHRVSVKDAGRDALLGAGREGRLTARVDAAHRAPTERHHTATHLLHAALRSELGTHARQAGSLVAPDRLRFDYTHFESPSAQQLARIEWIVNEWILADRAVKWETMPIDEARAKGAMALFGEKYGAEVRMVTVAGVEGEHIAPSLELCGGTHVERTGEIGAFAHRLRRRDRERRAPHRGAVRARGAAPLPRRARAARALGGARCSRAPRSCPSRSRS